MSEQSIQRMVEDLRRLDPAFKNDPNLSQMVREMVADKPDATIDERFQRELRARLTGASVTGGIKSPYQRWFWAAPAFAVVLLAIVVGRTTFFNRDDAGELALSPEIIELEGQAFGSLASEGVSPSISARAPLPAERSAVPPGGAARGMPMGMSMASEAPFASSMMAKDAAGGTNAMPSSMIYPYPMTEYVYEYVGGANPLTEKTGAVLKRLTGVTASQSLISAISKAKFAGLDLATFRSLEIQNLQVAEDLPGGYMINIDFIGDYISINKNWKFGNPYDEAPLTEDPKMSDEEAISIAEAFLKTHKISMSGFGKPIVPPQPDYMPMPLVDDAVRGMPPVESADTPLGSSGAVDTKMIAYWPETMMVVYPLIIDGTELYDEGGMPSGVQVWVSKRTKEVDSVQGLSSQNFERSSYPLVTEVGTLMSYLNKRSAFSFPPEDNMELKKQTVKLGTPTLVYMRHWKYDSNGGQSSEYLVPAAAFPIVEGGENHWIKTVVVPLVEDLLKIEQPDEPIYRIMEGKPAPAVE